MMAELPTETEFDFDSWLREPARCGGHKKGFCPRCQQTVCLTCDPEHIQKCEAAKP